MTGGAAACPTCGALVVVTGPAGASRGTASCSRAGCPWTGRAHYQPGSGTVVTTDRGRYLGRHFGPWRRPEPPKEPPC